MENAGEAGHLIARCIVCKGNIHERDPYEVWEGGFYCERHSLPHLRARAKEYSRQLEARSSATDSH